MQLDRSSFEQRLILDTKRQFARNALGIAYSRSRQILTGFKAFKRQVDDLVDSEAEYAPGQLRLTLKSLKSNEVLLHVCARAQLYALQEVLHNMPPRAPKRQRQA